MSEITDRCQTCNCLRIDHFIAKEEFGACDVFVSTEIPGLRVPVFEVLTETSYNEKAN